MARITLILLSIVLLLNENLHALPPINFTDTILTNRMIEALNEALLARDGQELSPFQQLRQQLYHQQQAAEQQNQHHIYQPQPQLYPQAYPEQQQQQQNQQFYPQYLSEQQQQQLYQQQFLDQQTLNQQLFQQPVPLSSPSEQQLPQATQQVYPSEQKPSQSVQQNYAPEQKIPQLVQPNYLPEQAQPQQAVNSDSRGYYYPYPYQNINWYNFASLWPNVAAGQANVAVPSTGAVVEAAGLGTSAGCPVGFCPKGATCSQLSGQWQCGCSTNDCIGIANPCGVFGQYYFPYYPDATRFIQCDQTGVFWIRRCAPGTIFDPKISVCNYPPVVVETGKK
ncbi:unnamed protein product [Adineta ricciae]|uniref:Chitin-binding type-2 domain-containing protein n=1 Tax=Adineta ricciae TaxID=249248 RepID=A0A814R1I6_ADIRI|nr:unnamed protein product [Adineta ricciae]CAF1127465.1 unnamed protein product [Adineta ricciae]